MMWAMAEAEGFAGLDTSVAHPARVYDYWLGGTNNFAADREAAERVLAAAPGLRYRVRANRAFLGRATRFLAAEAGLRQFLDIGTGIPAAGNTHEVAQRVAPDARVVYVDNDPIVLLHAQALLRSTPEGATAYVQADLRDPGAILDQAAALLDFGQPVAVMLLFTLAHVEGTARAAAIVSAMMAAVPSGSHLAVYHLASDLDPALPAVVRRWNRQSALRVTLRSRVEVAALVAGLNPVPPGLVSICEWRPAPTDPRFEDVVPVHAVLARKP
jgi:S-adenosyl methyltransferase